MSQMRTVGIRINKLAGWPVVEGLCDDDYVCGAEYECER